MPSCYLQIGLAARRREDAGVVGMLRSDMPAVTRQLSRQLKQKSVKTKVGWARPLQCAWEYIAAILRQRQGAVAPLGSCCGEYQAAAMLLCFRL